MLQEQKKLLSHLLKQHEAKLDKLKDDLQRSASKSPKKHNDAK